MACLLRCKTVIYLVGSQGGVYTKVPYIRGTYRTEARRLGVSLICQAHILYREPDRSVYDSAGVTSRRAGHSRLCATPLDGLDAEGAVQFLSLYSGLSGLSGLSGQDFSSRLARVRLFPLPIMEDRINAS